MTQQAIFNAVIGLAMMGVVSGVYVGLARRYRYLWHPASILVAVVAVSVVVSVLGVVVFGSGWVGAPAMLRQSAIGGFGWGVLIAAMVWASRRAYEAWTARR